MFHLIPFLSLLCVAPSSLLPSASPSVGAFCVPVLIFPPSLLHPGSDACLRGAQGPVQAARPWLVLCGCSGSSPLLPFAQLCPCPLLTSLILSALRVSQTFCSVLQGFVSSLISLAVSSFSPQKGEPEYPVPEATLSNCAVSELSVELFPFSLNFSGALISPPLFRSAWLFPAQPMHPRGCSAPGGYVHFSSHAANSLQARHEKHRSLRRAALSLHLIHFPGSTPALSSPSPSIYTLAAAAEGSSTQ